MSFAEPGPLTFPCRHGGTILVSRCPSEPGRWRATHVDADGEPTGHSARDTFADAVRAAYDRGALIEPRHRCWRCGDWHTLEPSNAYTPGVCPRCEATLTDLVDRDDDLGAFCRARARYQRNANHPTARALAAYFAAF